MAVSATAELDFTAVERYIIELGIWAWAVRFSEYGKKRTDANVARHESRLGRDPFSCGRVLNFENVNVPAEVL